VPPLRSGARPRGGLAGSGSPIGRREITVTPYRLHNFLRGTPCFCRCRSTSFAGAYGAAKTPLQRQTLLIVHQCSPDALAFHQGSFQFGAWLDGQKLGEISYTIKQQTHCDQPIVLSAKVCGHAGPFSQISNRRGGLQAAAQARTPLDRGGVQLAMRKVVASRGIKKTSPRTACAIVSPRT
jgi:hypothetical protein